jgi:glycosyltransferase involved in cell wall biosynthesis
MRALFFLPYSQEAAGCRYRVHQFVPYLEAHGVECELRELVKPDLYKILYKPGNSLRKVGMFAQRAFSRVADLGDARDYDLLFVYRECFPFGPAWMERYLRSLGKPIVYDFDDAIYLPDPRFAKDLVRAPVKTNVITYLADHVIICNEHLRGLCAAYNRNVWVIPTSVDTTNQFVPRTYQPPLPPGNGRPIRLGWIGSHSTAPYLQALRPVLQHLAAKHPLEFLVVGAGKPIEIEGVRVINRDWSLETEVEDFRSLDIGLYPLNDNLWELGKTSFKTIQYMAVGVPGVVSRVGTARQIVRDGDNGFLAGSTQEWIEKTERLILDPELRLKMGAAGRETAVSGFSVQANAPKLLEVLRAAASSPGRTS